MSSNPLFASDNQFLDIQPEIICRQELPSTQTLCPKLSHLHINTHWINTERLSLHLSWDPGHTRKPSWKDKQDLGQDLPARSSFLSRYTLRWQFAPDLELNFENWSATTLIPDASGLSFAQSLQDSGWEQSVLRLTFIKPDWHLLALGFIAGLSEGQTTQNRDSKPYLGILSRIKLATALELQLGGSYDADSLAPEALFWLNSDERKFASQGFLAKRAAASLILDGHHPYARGLRLAIGQQLNKITSSPKSLLTQSNRNFDVSLDPSELLPEVFGKNSAVQRRTFSVSASYLLLAEYLLAFHHQALQVQLEGDAAITSCAQLDLNGACLIPGQKTHALQIQEQTFGLGRVDARGWSFFMEYHAMHYDKLYELYHFAQTQNSRSQHQQVLQSRLTWSW